MPQDNDDLKQQQSLDEAKTAALNAEIARIRAERALQKELRAQAPSSADFAIPASAYKGNVTADAKAGGIESSLLAARAIGMGARRIAAKLKPALDGALANKPAGTPVLLLDYVNVPDFQVFVAYKTQYTVVQKAMAGALETLNAAQGTDAAGPRYVTPALAGLALESLDQLLGFFRTDYSVQGVDVKFADNLPLISAVAAQLIAEKYGVEMPTAYTAPANLADDPIFSEVTVLADQDTTLRQAIAAAERQLAAAAPPPDSSAPPNGSSSAANSALKDALATAKCAQALYDAFYARLISRDDKGRLALDAVMRQNAIRAALQQGSPLLAVRIENAGGTYYTRKNLWSFFGGMPFYNMGGVVLTYSLFAGDTGRALATGTIPVDGGFVRISRLPAELAK